MTEKAVLGQAQRILVDATSDIWHKISTWTHASDVEMPDGTPLNTYLTDMNDDINEKFDEKYGSLPNTITDISTFDAIPDLTYGRLHTVAALTDGKYTIGTNHYLYSYSGSHPKTIQRFAVLIDTTDLAHLEMYIADKNIENRWTLTKIATQDQIDDLQQQINDLSTEFNNLNLFVQQSIGGLNQLYQILQNQMDWLEAELAELQEQLNDLLNELRDYKKQTNARLDKLEAIWNKLYGYVGSIFITHVQPSIFDPGDVFGGTWALVDGFLRATSVGVQPIETSRDDNRVNGISTSAMTLGDDEFTIKVENLPPHWHGFGEAQNDKDWALHVRLRNEKNYTPLPLTDFKTMVGEGGVQKTLLAFSDNYKSELETYSAGGHLWGWNGTQNNDKDGNMMSKPVIFLPRHFHVYCWLRVE